MQHPNGQPNRRLKACLYPGCPKASPEAYCSEHRKEAKARNRPAKSREARGYGYDWIQFRKLILARDPYCAVCREQGIVKAACEVDHIIPHKLNHQLRFDPNNCQSICKECHGKKSARESREG